MQRLPDLDPQDTAALVRWLFAPGDAPSYADGRHYHAHDAWPCWCPQPECEPR